MRIQQALAGGFLAFILTAGWVGAAHADVYARRVVLQPGAGEMTIRDLNVGDTLVLTLVNPTSYPLTFATTEQLGPEARWTVPAQSQVTVSYNYTRPFTDDVEYTVTTPTGAVISQGTLLPAQKNRGMTPVSEQSGTPVRGYW